jgi:penicillin-binding protein 1C
MLRDYRYERFHDLLKRVGMTTLKQGPDRYGLSLILGGAEGTLWDITGMYASMARTLNNFFERPGKNKYAKRDFRSPSYLKSPSEEIMILEGSGPISAGSVYITLNTLTELHRPGEESGWKYFNSAKKIAWKTGTSFGFRDAWAVGVTPNYAVGVWVGNAEGEGRPGLTGTDAAAPIMFDIFSQLPNDTWFLPPSLELEKISVCTSSGSRATSICHNTDTVFVTKAGLSSGLCVDHRMVHLTYDEKYRVNSLCEDVNRMKHKSWFVLPPVQEYYFRAINLSYKSLPPFKSSCHVDEQFASMDMIYPKDKTKLFIPRSLDGSPGSSIFELAHRNSKATVFWHLDGKYLGSTQSVHQIAVNPVKGKHTLTLVDDSGESITRQFEVVSSM